ncbi:hypothetical protein A7U60_g8666 [Sanghuangporus baumii]|uniref:Uncharacterized protein n=1 Tax=Sanghuangporus baumii TaxID=108892 RepID=A0A9Q5HQ90_SANBA|nr:hypothetical protein A7U60_g8666 [Sanghuangporus baumii]
MLYIFAAFTFALKLLMLAQPSGDASPDFYDFGHDVDKFFQEDPIDFWCPLRGSFSTPVLACPAPPAPVVIVPPPATKTFQYFIGFADETLEFPTSRPAPVPTRSSSIQSSVNVDVGADHIPAPTSTRKYIPADTPLPLEPSIISWVLIFSLVVSSLGISFGMIMSGALRSVALRSVKDHMECSRWSMMTWALLSCIPVSLHFVRVSVLSTHLKEMLDSRLFALVLLTVALASLKLWHSSFDAIHHQGPCMYTGSATITLAVGMLTDSIAIDLKSSIEEMDANEERRDSAIAHTDPANSCPTAPIKPIAGNEAATSSTAVMYTSANEIASKSTVDAKTIGDAEVRATNNDVEVSVKSATDHHSAHTLLPKDRGELATSVPIPFKHDDTHGSTIPAEDRCATIIDCITSISISNGFIDPSSVPLPEPLKNELEINPLDVPLPEDQSGCEAPAVNLEVIEASPSSECSLAEIGGVKTPKDMIGTSEPFHSDGEESASAAPSLSVTESVETPVLPPLPVAGHEKEKQKDGSGSRPSARTRMKGTPRISVGFTRNFLLNFPVRGDDEGKAYRTKLSKEGRCATASDIEGIEIPSSCSSTSGGDMLMDRIETNVPSPSDGEDAGAILTLVPSATELVDVPVSRLVPVAGHEKEKDKSISLPNTRTRVKGTQRISVGLTRNFVLNFPVRGGDEGQGRGTSFGTRGATRTVFVLTVARFPIGRTILLAIAIAGTQEATWPERHIAVLSPPGRASLHIAVSRTNTRHLGPGLCGSSPSRHP